MIPIDYIILLVQKLIKRYGTSDPFKICTELKVSFKFVDFDDLMGMYAVLGRNRYILLKQDLPEFVLYIVCLHELGHDQLHRELAKSAPLRDSALFRRLPIEHEANIFTAEFKHSDEATMELVRSGYSVDQIAKATESFSDLVSIKLELLRHKGHELKNIEYNPNFLKFAEVGSYDTDYTPC